MRPETHRGHNKLLLVGSIPTRASRISPAEFRWFDSRAMRDKNLDCPPVFRTTFMLSEGYISMTLGSFYFADPTIRLLGPGRLIRHTSVKPAAFIQLVYSSSL